LKLLPSLSGTVLRRHRIAPGKAPKIRKITQINQTINFMSHFSDKPSSAPIWLRGKAQKNLSPFHDTGLYSGQILLK